MKWVKCDHRAKLNEWMNEWMNGIFYVDLSLCQKNSKWTDSPNYQSKHHFNNGFCSKKGITHVFCSIHFLWRHLTGSRAHKDCIWSALSHFLTHKHRKSLSLLFLYAETRARTLQTAVGCFSITALLPKAYVQIAH